MRYLPFIVALIAPSLSGLVICGCSKKTQPEKTTIEKLESQDPIEQRKGLDEADKKYGGSL